ncbi:MAG: GIY-YIG nuclease family protein [Chloroflexi bacterium]|nr:GIY-YIG nuclease family protein [Chloroflexota bacterium]
MKKYYIYIMSNLSRTLYIGITGNLYRRIYEHKNKTIPGFTERYNVTKLVYYEEFESVISAITREKQVKKWRRSKKVDLVDSMNPDWDDLSKGWFD